MKLADKKTAPRRYFLYARKSTDEADRQILSIDAQLNEMRDLARLEHLTIEREFIESMSAKQPGRPIFNMMMDEISRGTANSILAWHPDRIARNSMDGGKIIYFLDSGVLVDLRFKAFWFENTPQGKFILNMAFGESKYYVDALAENVWRGIRHKLTLGQYPGPPPFGYLNEPKARTIVVNEQAATIVRKIFRAFSSGRYTLRQIREKGTLLGVRNSKGLPRSSAWYAALLSEPFFIGMIRFDGRYYPGSHKALISKPQFYKVQHALLSHIRSRLGWGNKRFAFRGMHTCEECGCAVTAQVEFGHHYYRCTHKKGPCPVKSYIREEELAAFMWSALRRASLSDRTAENMNSKAYRMRDRAGATVAEMLAIYKARLAHAEEALAKIDELRAANELEDELYNSTKRKYFDAKARLVDKVREIEKKGDNYWLEPLTAFIEKSRQARLIAESGSLDDMRDWFHSVGADLSLANPDKPDPPDAITCRQTKPRPKQPGRKFPEPVLRVRYPYPWKILAHRSPKARWDTLLKQLVAYFKDPMHPDYADT